MTDSPINTNMDRPAHLVATKSLRDILADYPLPYDVRAHVDSFSWDENAAQLDRFYRGILGLAPYPQSGGRWS